MQSEGAEVFLPATFNIQISEDGENFSQLYDEVNVVTKTGQVVFRNYQWKGKAKTRFVKISARSGKEFGGWLFTDEVVVE